MDRQRENQQREELLRYLDGALPEEDRVRVGDELRSSPEKRQLLRELAEHEVVIADHARGENCQRAGTDPRSQPREKLPIIWPIAITASLILLLGLSSLFLLRGASREIVTIVEVTGPVRWTGNGGLVEPLVADGEKLSGGTIETLAPTSAVILRFADGSEISLPGESEATFSDTKGQKQVHLKRGDLTADIRKQPAGRPFRIATPTADLEVLGTRFEVQSEADSTHLTVMEGAVRVTRRVDGSSIEVPAKHETKASLDRRVKLEAKRQQQPIHSWCSDPGLYPAEPKYLPRTKRGRGDVMIYQVKFRIAPDTRERLELSADSRVVIRGSLAESGSIEIMLGLTRKRGGFLGNYFYRTDELPPGPWELELTADQFNKWNLQGEKLPPNLPQLRQIVLYTIGVDAGLEVEQAAVIGGSDLQK